MQDELDRLMLVGNEWARAYFPDLGNVSVYEAPLSGRANSSVALIGDRDIEISIKQSRLIRGSTDRSLIFGRLLLPNDHGESIRHLEADLSVLKQLLRASQFKAAQSLPHVEAEIRDYGGYGSWFARSANRLWAEICKSYGLPFVPVRHRNTRAEKHQQYAAIAERVEMDRASTHTRPPCSEWPMCCFRTTRSNSDSSPAWQQEEIDLRKALNQLIPDWAAGLRAPVRKQLTLKTGESPAPEPNASPIEAGESADERCYRLIDELKAARRELEEANSEIRRLKAEASQSQLRKIKSAKSKRSAPSPKATISAVDEAIAKIAEGGAPPRGWKSALARDHKVAPSTITARIKALGLKGQL